jgi:hypothetical protein
MSSPNRKPYAFFHPVPQRLDTSRIMARRWDPKTGRLEEVESVYKNAQFHNPARQIKKHLAGKYTYCRVEREP